MRKKYLYLLNFICFLRIVRERKTDQIEQLNWEEDGEEWELHSETEHETDLQTRRRLDYLVKF